MLKAGRHAVAEGRAESLSAWVNDALARQAEHDRRMTALGQFIRGFEAEHGVISDEEIRAARRHFRARGITVRPSAGQQRRATGRRRKGAA